MLGFAFSWVCGDLWFLAQLFVSRGDRSGYVGQWALSGGHGWTNARKFSVVFGLAFGFGFPIFRSCACTVTGPWMAIITLAGWFSVFGGQCDADAGAIGAVAMPVVGTRAGTMTSGALFLLLGVYLRVKRMTSLSADVGRGGAKLAQIWVRAVKSDEAAYRPVQPVHHPLAVAEINPGPV